MWFSSVPPEKFQTKTLNYIIPFTFSSIFTIMQSFHYNLSFWQANALQTNRESVRNVSGFIYSRNCVGVLDSVVSASGFVCLLACHSKLMSSLSTACCNPVTAPLSFLFVFLWFVTLMEIMFYFHAHFRWWNTNVVFKSVIRNTDTEENIWIKDGNERLYKEEICNLCSPSNIVILIKSKTIIWEQLHPRGNREMRRIIWWPLHIDRHKWEYDIKTNLKEIGYGDENRIQLAQDYVHWWTINAINFWPAHQTSAFHETSVLCAP
jgi:hypothetical protein